MLVSGIQKTSLIDFPGKIAATIFLSGCNFRCPFCYNIDLVLGSTGLGKYSEDDVLNFLESRKGLLDGVCITGGEPCMNPELEGFIAEIKKLGFLVKLDTNGTNPEMLERLVRKKMVDYIAMDIKAPLERYRDVVRTDVDMEKISRSAEIVMKGGIDYEFRTTVVPSITKKEDILAIGKWLKGSKRYFIQQFRGGRTLDGNVGREKPYSLKELEELKCIAKPFFDEVEIRNV